MQDGNETCGGEMKNKWKGKSHLEQKLIIALVIVTFLLIGILLFIIIKYSISPNICTTPVCILAASQIVSSIDPSIDPCENFFQFACGNFLRNAQGTSPIKEMEEKIQRQLDEILSEPIKVDENPWIRFQKQFFKACMNESAVEQESLDVFQLTLEELNGWPVVVGYRWNEDMFNWTNMVFHLKDKGYPYSMLLDVDVRSDLINNNRFIVTISNSYVSKIKDEQKQIYKDYMTDVAVLFGADRNYAKTEMEKVLEFQEGLRNIYDNLYAKAENETFNLTAVLLRDRMTVKEYQTINGEVVWLDFINKILFPIGKIASDDYVIFSSAHSIESFFRLLYSTSRRTVANYIIWEIIGQIMPFMSKELKQRAENYICATGGTPMNKHRQEFCKMEMSGTLRPLDIMYARKYLPVEHRKKVKQIFRNVKSEFISALKEVSWMDEESRTKAVEKAKDVADIIGAPGDYFNDAVFSQFLGDNTDIESSNFFTMFLNLSKIKLNLSFFKIHMNVNDTELDRYYGYITLPNAWYLVENEIVIPVSFFERINYHVDGPMYINYGTLGSIIGHELTHGFDEMRIEYVKDGDEIQPWTNATKEAFREKIKCIIKEADEYSFGDSEFQMNGTASLQENLADFTGGKVSYAAYNKWTQQNGREPFLPAISYTPKQLFWISSVSYYCFKEDKAKNNLYAHNSFRTNAPLRNNPHFAYDFNCPLGSKMNPSEKCQVY